MPIVKMPDGAQVQFPDDMPPEQIKAMILQKFPDAGGQAQPAAPVAQEQPWAPPGVLAPVQFQEGTGAMRLAVPSLITDTINAVQAPGKALQGGYDQLTVNQDTGAVSPFDPRMVDDAANLASMISPVSAASRIGPPVAKAVTRAAKAATPSIDDLYATKDAAYAFVDKLGARYSADAMDELGADMIRRASQDNISPTRHAKAYSVLEDLAATPQSQSLTQLDQARQTIYRDLVKPDPRGADAHFGKMFIEAIDNFIEKATPDKIAGVQGQTASYAIRAARNANKTLRRSETVQDIIENARLSAAASGSGGNIDNSIRQGFARVLKSDKLSTGFSKEELAQMEKIVVGGGKGQNALRLLGKLSPSGNGLMAALGVGATMTNPAMAAAPLAGLAAKTLSDRATQRGVDRLTTTVRTGGANIPPLPGVPGQGLSPLTPKANTTLIQQNFGQKLLNLPNKSFVRLDA